MGLDPLERNKEEIVMDFLIAFGIGIPAFIFMVKCWGWYFRAMMIGGVVPPILPDIEEE